MNKNKIILSALLLASTQTISADFLGLEAGYAMWKPSLSGDIKGGSAGNIDLEDDLAYGSSTNGFFWAYFDHPLPLLPNIKIQQTNYSDSSTGTQTVTFLGQSYSGNISSELTLNQTDIIAYWRILDNWVNLDLGVNIKNIKGNVKLSSVNNATATDKDFNVAVPMLYAKARFDLPFSGLSVEADMSKISYSDNSISDMKAGLVYESSFGLGAIAGLKSQSIKFDDLDDVKADISISGIYAGVFYHF